jgi:hypothetical protein
MSPLPRIAIVMTGAPRSLPDLSGAHAARVAELRTFAEVDLFLHAWRPDEPWSPEVLDAVERLGPHTVSFDDPWSRADTTLWPGYEPDDGVTGRLNNFVGMWASAARGFALAEAEEERRGRPYDLVIRTRPDLLWDLPGETGAVLRDGRNRIPRIYSAGPSPADVAAVLSRADAGTYFRIADRLDELDRRLRSRGLTAFVAEYALEEYLDWQGVRWEEFRSPLVIVRLNGDLHWFRCGPEHRAYHAARSSITYHGDGLPRTASTDAFAPERIAADLAINVFTGAPVPDGLPERVSSVWRGVHAGDPSAMRRAVRLADGIPALRRRPASLAPIGIAHQAGHLLRRKGVSRRDLVRQSPARMLRLGIGVARYRLEAHLRDRRWIRRLTAVTVDPRPRPW